MKYQHPPIARMLEFQASRALVIFHPNGDHFFPQLTTAVLNQWKHIEREIGHEAWMRNAAQRATPTGAQLN